MQFHQPINFEFVVACLALFAVVTWIVWRIEAAECPMLRFDEEDYRDREEHPWPWRKDEGGEG